MDYSRLHPPRTSERLCVRSELLASLDKAFEPKMTLIVAPAGYGKTSLLSQWCERLDQSGIAIAYYAARERDRDPSAFLAMLTGALSVAGLDMGALVQGREGRIRHDITLDDILIRLELAGQPLVMIIDDFEQVNDDAINDVVADFVQAAPPTVHFVITSRQFPALPVSSLDIRGQLRMIDAYQLKLSNGELASMLDLPADNDEVATISKHTQGWPVTVELYRLWRQRHAIHDSRATFGGHVAEVQNYLTEQLFSSLPSAHLDLLIDIADLDEVDARLVDRMRGQHDSALILEEISETLSSLIWTGQERDEKVYRLHPLLLENLRQKLHKDEDRRERLAVNAAMWFLENFRFAEAIRSARASSDSTIVEKIVAQIRPIHLMVAESATTLRQILRELPEDFIASRPRLQLMAAIAHFKAGFFIESRNMLERVRTKTQNFTVDPDGHPEWLTVEGNLTDLIFLCQVGRMSSRIEELIAIIRDTAPDDPIIWGSCENVMTLVEQVRGDFDSADAAVTKARSIYSTIRLSDYGETQIAGQEMLILLGRGRLREVMHLIGRYQQHSSREELDDMSTPLMIKIILAVVRYEQEFSDTAVELLKNSFAEHSKAESWFDQYAIAYPVILMRTYVQEGADAAFDYIALAQAKSARLGIEALPDFLSCLEIEYHIRNGDLDAATRLAERLDLEHRVDRNALTENQGWREFDAFARALIKLRLGEQRYDDALRHAQDLVASGHTGGRLRAEIQGWIFSALARAGNDQMGQAATHLLKAVLLAYPEGFIAPFAEEGAALSPIIRALLADRNLDAYARRHLEEVEKANRKAMAQPNSNELNEREREVVEHLAEGLSNKMIARRMGITDHTVKFHLKKVFSKLEVSSRKAAVAKAFSGTLRTDDTP